MKSMGKCNMEYRFTITYSEVYLDIFSDFQMFTLISCHLKIMCGISWKLRINIWTLFSPLRMCLLTRPPEILGNSMWYIMFYSIVFLDNSMWHIMFYSIVFFQALQKNNNERIKERSERRITIYNTSYNRTP